MSKLKSNEESGDESEKCSKKRPAKKEKNIFTYMESTGKLLTTQKQYQDCWVVFKVENKSPKSLLYESIKQNRKIKVWTRSHTYVRSICIGYLIAFDRYWNLAMIDIDEIYKVPIVKLKPGKAEEAKADEADGDSVVDTNSLNKIDKSKLVMFNRKHQKVSVAASSVDSEQQDILCDFKSKGYQMRFRHMSQILLRGDNIVMVTFAD